MKSGRLALDDRFLIINEYMNKTKPRTGNRAGDAFVKWALNNHANKRHVNLVNLIDNPVKGFEAFPDGRALANFDGQDRKFVAVAATHHAKPPILQAADSKWLDWSEALATHGIVVIFLCPEDIERFRSNKAR